MAGEKKNLRLVTILSVELAYWHIANGVANHASVIPWIFNEERI